MFSRYVFSLALAVALVGLCSAQSSPPPLSQDEQALVERAKALVETETGVAATNLSVTNLEPVEWNDASLGCPQPGRMYAQVVTPGYRVTLAGPSGENYDVHTAAAPDGSVVLCTQDDTAVKAPAPQPTTPQLTPPQLTPPQPTTPLTGVVWHWQTEGLEDTSSYTVAFLPDGQLAIRADCNRGRASYATFGANGLRVGAAATTRAACPPGSLGGAFLEQLVSSTSYTLDGDTLTLYPVVAPGTMRFTPVASAGAVGVQAGGAEDEVVLRAAGNEPGWRLELLASGAARFLYNYGEQELTAQTSFEETVAGATYRADTRTHTLEVTVTKAACSDSMSGEAFALTVTVTLDGATYQGCGRRLG